MRVVVVAEYYPRAADPVLGVWAHRQALAARDAGADVRVLVLHRPVPPRAALRAAWPGALRAPRPGELRAARPRAWRAAGREELRTARSGALRAAGREQLRAARPGALLAPLRQPLRSELDGIAVTYVPFLAPPRPRTYGSWGAWAAPSLAVALRRLRRSWPFDLVHAHYAAPAGDAVRRARPGVPLVVSVHGGDVLAVARNSDAGRRAVEGALDAARLVIANSAGTAERCAALGARDVRVVHLGTDLPAATAPPDPRPPRLVTVAHLVARKRHEDVLRALWLLRDRHPGVEWDVVGDGPERPAIERLARELGLAERVHLRGALPPAQAAAAAQAATLFVLPSVDEAFGVAYVEAMAGGVPAIGCRGEAGPEEIAAAGGDPGAHLEDITRPEDMAGAGDATAVDRAAGIRLVPPRDPEALAAELDILLHDHDLRRRLGAAARATVAAHFTWEACGRSTVAAYEEALR